VNEQGSAMQKINSFHDPIHSSANPSQERQASIGRTEQQQLRSAGRYWSSNSWWQSGVITFQDVPIEIGEVNL
jgi:hypothetical protein